MTLSTRITAALFGLVVVVTPAVGRAQRARAAPSAAEGEGARGGQQPARLLRAEHAPVRRFEVVDYLATLAATGVYYAIEFGLDSPRGAEWTKPVPVLDEPTRDLLMLGSREARQIADRGGDLLWYSATVYPVLLSIAGPLAQGRSFDQVWQMSMMNLQVFMVASILVRIPHKLLGRERPDAVGCRENPDHSVNCGSVNQYVSFFGGHAAISITGASLACAHHQHAQPLGGGLADRLGCAGAMAAAGGVFLSRLFADRHWLSDQLVSIVVGFGVGYGLPTLLYYKPFWRPSREHRSNGPGPRHAIVPVVSRGHLGAAWLATF